MPFKSIHSRAPTRIDLAGGTVDLWPLYLFLNDPVTVNVAIDLFAEARIEQLPARNSEGEILLKSEDQNLEMKVPWGALGAFLETDHIQAPPALELHFRLLRYFVQRRAEAGQKKLNFDLSLTTRARSPAGAGLGGSSTLSVAIVGALASWAGEGAESANPLDREKLVEIVRDIETTVIHVPAGVQDYYGAMFGGLQSLRWKPGSHQRSWLPTDILPELEKRLILFYSGQSRNSGINNWALFKAFIDNQGDVRTKFDKITRAAERLEQALRGHDWEAAGSAIADEWAVRRTLAPGITTPEIDRAFEKAEKIAPVAGKVCGAGGGGCFFVYLPSADQEKRARIEAAFVTQGIQVLPFHIAPHGLDVQVSRA
ncbi:MAG TPA: hypothetical protein VJB59_02450 [Bdellovibrionota bacterium]|nr:hypothetical protein [Bdellovibrionota bacterium]